MAKSTKKGGGKTSKKKQQDAEVSRTSTKVVAKRGKSPLVEHRKRNCECCECWLYITRSAPPETSAERAAKYRYDEREIKKAIRQAKRDVKAGRQFTIEAFFGMK